MSVCGVCVHPEMFPRRRSAYRCQPHGCRSYGWGRTATAQARRRGRPVAWLLATLVPLAVEEITFDWVSWYNNERLHSFLGNIPPEEYERNYYAQNIGAPTGDAANKTAA